MKKVFSLKNLNLKNKRVLVRVDFNVPLQKGKITDNKRIKSALPTIKYILSKKPQQLILMSHLGRPNGKIVSSLKMDVVAKELQKLLRKPVKKINNFNIPKDKIILLENLRFNKQEKNNDLKFAKKLASLADIYINDAFGTCHRKHASVYGITKYLPSAAGLLLEKEIRMLSKLEKPKKPFIAIIGGVKVSDKINVIKSLLKKTEAILIGGAMMFTFYKSIGVKTRKSIVEEDKLNLAKKLLKSSKRRIILPIDTVVSSKFDKPVKTKTVEIDLIPKNMIGVDIGSETIDVYKQIISKAKTIVWNGPMGVFEVPKFAKGTNEIAKAIAKNKGLTIIGGGDSAAAVEKFENKFTHVSTGGGASLEFLEGKKLPAIKALEDNYKKFS